MRTDLIIRNGHVVDPANDIDMIADVALADGKVSAVAAGMDVTTTREVIDACGLLVVPGIIDSHVHLVGGGAEGLAYNMLLRRGVTTAMDMMGDIDTFMQELKVSGHGLNAACLHALVIGVDVKSSDAGREEVGEAIDKALDKGAFGIKIMGGHYPFTPKTTACIMEECNKRGVYVAIHAGSTESGSNIKGFEEAVALSGGRPLHVCHTNAYCRGQVESPLLETQRLLTSLEKNPHIVSESYLSVMNGTSAAVDGSGKVKSAVTRTWLERKGYTSDKSGMGKAIKDGWALIYGRVGGELDFLPSQAGFDYWESLNSNVWCSFPVNDPTAMLACAIARRSGGAFTVNAVSTDGGRIPRNVIFENGIRLAQIHYMTLQDLVLKSTLYPARMLGLLNKGHLTPGADGDVAVFNPQTGQAQYTIVGGKVRMAAGICGDGPGLAITSPQGAKAFAANGIEAIVPDLEKSTFKTGNA